MKKSKTWFGELQSKGKFGVDLQTLAKARDYVKAGWASEAEVKDMIQKVYTEQSYVLDPHTAVAVRVYQKYMECTGDSTYTIIASTASPFKFAGTVLQSIISEQITENEWENLAQLSALTGWTIPMGLQGLEKRQFEKWRKQLPQRFLIC